MISVDLCLIVDGRHGERRDYKSRTGQVVSGITRGEGLQAAARAIQLCCFVFHMQGTVQLVDPIPL